MRIKFVLLIAMIAALGIGSGVYAKPCTLTPAKTPTLFGFKFGMTQSAAEKKTGQKAESNWLILGLGTEKATRVPTGEMYMIIFNEKKDSKLVDETVKSMTLSFMDGKLYEMSLNLKSPSEWVTAPDTAAFFQQKFGIPADAWVETGDNARFFKKKVTCDGVTIDVKRYTTEMKFEMSETAVLARVEAARKAAREKHLNK